MAAFLVFLIAYTLSQFFRVFLAVVAPELMRDLKLDAAALGGLTAAWSVAFALAQFPVGYGLDRFGPRRTVPALMTAAAAGAWLLAHANGHGMATLAMALIGIGCAPIYMGALYLFGRTLPADQFGRMAAWMLALGSLGNLAAAAPLGWASATIGWRAALTMVAAATFASAIAVVLVVRDPPVATITATTAHQSGGVFSGIMAVLRIRSLWPLLPLVGVSYAVILAERGLWAGPYLATVHGLDVVDRGQALNWMALAMSAGAVAFGVLDRPGPKRKRLVVAGTVMAALGFAGLAMVPVGVTGAVLLLALLGGAGHTYTLLMAHGRAFLPDHLLGRGITTLNFLFLGGVAVMQLTAGAIISALTAQGLSPADLYRFVHAGFALLLVLAVGIYLHSRAEP